MENGAELPEFLDGLLRTGNNNGIKTEKKSGKCGRDRPQE